MVDTGAVAEPREELRDAFARIEAAVDAGDTDLSRLGFWRVLRRLKADPELATRWAEVAGRIDRKAFEAGVRWRFPVWLGNAVLVVGTLVGGFAVVVAMNAGDEVIAGAALVAAAGIWSVSVHCLAHWVVGRLVGIRFTSYSFGGPFPPRPGLKTDYATYLRTPAGRARVDACLWGARDEGCPVRGARLLVGDGGAGLGGVGLPRARRAPGPHRRVVLDEVERLEEGRARAPGGASSGRPRVKRFLAIVALLALPGACEPMAAGGGADGNTAGMLGTEVLVTRVVDGDTAEVLLDGREVRVRFIGIDTPETVAPDQPVECYGKQASAYTTSRVEGRTVRLEFDVERTDRYGRTLAYVWIGDELLNETLVAEGYAVVSTFPPDVGYVDRFVAAQRDAREAGRGLWGACPG